MTTTRSVPTKELIQTILKLKTPDEAWLFFRDLLTEKELDEFAGRWRTARLLKRNVPYTTIEKETGLSSATIARVSRWLNSGMGGYQSAIKKAGKAHRDHHPPRKRLAS